MKIININNQKGGVGKTTTVTAMANILSERGKRVLVVDCDGSSTTLTKLLLDELENAKTIKSTLTDLLILQTTGRDISKELAKSVLVKCKHGYDLLPADNNLVGAVANLSMQNNLETRFKSMENILKLYKKDYDYMLLDAAPVLDIFSINELIASDELLIISQCQEASKNAINELLQSVNSFVLPMKKIKIAGILLTMFDKRTKYGKEKIEEIGRVFDIPTFKAVIPRNINAERYLGKDTSILTDRRNKVGEAYIEFIDEYLKG